MLFYSGDMKLNNYYAFFPSPVFILFLYFIKAKIALKAGWQKPIILAATKKVQTMVFFPLSVLALAAGVYLLITVKREYLGGTFKILAWLIIVLSLVAIGFGGYKAVSQGGKCGKQKHCNVEKQVIIKKGGAACPHSATGNGCHVQGDSVVMDEATCAGIMGKEGCAAMIKERGQCIMSKDECTKACATAGKNCCIKGQEGATCPNTGTKECCKKI